MLELDLDFVEDIETEIEYLLCFQCSLCQLLDANV